MLKNIAKKAKSATDETKDHASKLTKAEMVTTQHRINWYNYEHFKRWKFEPVNWLIEKIQDLHDNKYNLSRSSSFARTIPIEFAKLYISLDRVDTICTIFKIEKIDLKAGQDDSPEQYKININYAYLYSTIGNKNTLTHRYACVGPSLESYDGEFRYRFNKPDIVISMIKREGLYDMWLDLHRYMSQKRINENLMVYIDYFYPRMAIEDKYNKVLETDISNKNYKDHLLVLSWFSELIHIYQNIQENHINKKFNDIMFSNIPADIAFMRKMILKYGESNITLFEHIVTHMTMSRISQTPVFGQKIIPLNLSDVQCPLDVNGAAWNEIYINELVNALVVNVISPGFPIYADWFYIKNTSKNLFDNTKIYERLKYSENAKWISKKLAEAQRQTYYISNETINGVRKYITPNFKDLCYHINDNIDIVKSMSMSNVALCTISEYVGRTIADIPHLITKSARYKKIYSNVFRIDYFRKYMFEIVYALYCANSKCGVIHGDLHLNNATLTEILSHPEEAPDPKIRDSTYVLYILDSKSIDICEYAKLRNKKISYTDLYKTMDDYKNKYQFMFHHEFRHASLIDFSRGIVHPDFLNYNAFLNSKGSTTIYHERKEEYINQQRATIQSKYSKILESFDDSIADKLKIGLINNFNSMWKIFTAYDIFSFTDKLRRLLNTSKIKIDPECITLLKKMNSIARYHLNALLPNVVDNKIPSSDLEYPNYNIIKECFSECIVDLEAPRVDKIAIGDIFIYSNEIKYSLDKYDNFPPYAQNWYGVKNINTPDDQYKQLDTSRVKYIKRRKDLEIAHKKSMNMIWFIAQRQQEKNI